MPDPDATDREYDYEEYWRDPGSFAAKGLTRAYWSDPWPERQGMLTAEHIREYHEAVGRMIRPFDPQLLKPASYELTLGARCLVEGVETILTDDSPVLTIPPNSIAFVSMQQVLCLPHYVVGRFDLAIQFIYQGLLLGTGPQVDPGFQGGLSCPLHNISNDPIEIRLNESFAKLDFAKTVPHAEQVREEWANVSTEDELRGWFRAKKDERPYFRLFKGGDPAWRKPIFGYLDGKRPTSSVAALRGEFKGLDQSVRAEVSRLGRFGSYSLLALIATLLLGVPAFVFGIVDAKTGDQAKKSDVTKLEQRLQSQTRAQSDQIDKLEGQIKVLRRRIKARSP